MLNTLTVNVSNQEDDFQNSISSYECSFINFKASGIMSAVNSLGSMELKKFRPSSIAYKISKQAQTQPPALKQNLKYRALTGEYPALL